MFNKLVGDLFDNVMVLTVLSCVMFFLLNPAPRGGCLFLLFLFYFCSPLDSLLFQTGLKYYSVKTEHFSPFFLNSLTMFQIACILICWCLLLKKIFTDCQVTNPRTQTKYFEISQQYPIFLNMKYSSYVKKLIYEIYPRCEKFLNHMKS